MDARKEDRSDRVEESTLGRSGGEVGSADRVCGGGDREQMNSSPAFPDDMNHPPYASLTRFFADAAPPFAFFPLPPLTMSAMVVCSKIFAAASRTSRNTS